MQWDRGTLTLDLPDAERLPGVLWDPRVKCWRAPAWRDAQLRAATGATLVPLDAAPRAAPALRPYQAAALSAWAAAGRRGVVVLPTGAGKTRTAIAAILRTGVPTLCIAPTRVLVGQWRAALHHAGVARVGQLGDGVRDVQRITVATTASARLHADRHGAAFALLVVDEVHHHAGTDETLELYAAPFRLGLTATPPEAPPERLRLDTLVGPVVYQMGVGDLTGTFLSTFDLVRVDLELSADEDEAYHALMSRFRAVYASWVRTVADRSWASFVSAAVRSHEGRHALSAWRRARRLTAWPACKRVALQQILARHTRARTLVFAIDNDTAYTIARDHLVAPITCDIGKAERDERLADFAAGRLRTLVSARVLNEGLDVPSAEVAVLGGGSQGSREYVQRVGRVLRPAEGKRAVVYDLVVRGTHEERQLDRGRKRLAAR
jgi:superfamily II DNA or RNA helicase